MKRFFLVSAMAIVFAAVIRIAFDTVLVFVALITIILAIGLLLIFKHNFKIMHSLIAFVLITVVMYLYTDGYITHRKAVDKLIGTTQTIDWTLVEEPEFNGYNYTYIVKPDSDTFNDISFDFKLRLYCQFNTSAEIYDRLHACIDFSELHEDMLLNYYSDNVLLSGKLRYCAVNKNENKPVYYTIKKHIVDSFKSDEVDDINGIPIAILTGDKSYISGGLYRDIKATGMAHVMAVSGFHISVICMGIVNLIKGLKVGKKLSAIAGLVALFILAGVAGFTGSVLRAGLMYIIMFSGEIFSRRPDALNSLGFAITALCIFNPYSMFSVSLLLSAMGTLGILVLSPPLTEIFIEKAKLRGIFKRVYSFIMQILIVSFSAGVFVLPVSLIVFGYVSTLSVVVNLFITIPVYVNIFSSILYIVFFNIPYVSAVILCICEASSHAFKFIIETFGEFDFAVFYKDDILLYILIGIVLICFLLIYIFKKRLGIVSAASSFAICAFVIILVIQQNINSSLLRVSFIPSDSGNLVIAESGGETVLITSTGDSDAISEAYYCMYERLNESIEHLIIASDDTTVLEKAITLSEKLEIENISLCKNIKSIKANEIELNIIQSADLYDILISLNGEFLAIDNSGTNSFKADYILTRNPLLTYKINGNHSKYIINEARDDAISASGYISKRGGETAVLSDFGIITAEKIGNNILKFER